MPVGIDDPLRMTELLVGVGAAAHATGADGARLGPHHPSTHGVLQVALTLSGDVVETAEPVVGFMHRGAEKLFEVRDYRQVVMLANRHDWLSAFSNELGICLAVERMLGMSLPDRAVWLRTLLAELNRVLNGLAFLGALDPDRQVGFVEREALQAVMEEATGGRMHYMFNRIGGLAADVPAGWTDRVRAALDGVRATRPCAGRRRRRRAARDRRADRRCRAGARRVGPGGARQRGRPRPAS